MHSYIGEKLSWVIGAFGMLMILAIAACKPDPCEDVTCQNGICLAGACACNLYYEGAQCETESRSKFLGVNWYNSRSCPGSSKFFVSKILVATTHAGAITITNVHQDPDTVSASVNGDTLIVPMQVYGFEYIEGTGFYSDGSITLQYNVIQTGGEETACIAHFTH